MRHLLRMLPLAGLVACAGDPAAPPSGSGSNPPIPAAASTWIRNNARILGGDDPRTPDTDLEPLRQMVGNARVVALGEGTHGTREFFRTKHRILQFLVERMGFTDFAIEATWPEANRLNDYVRTGIGSPDSLLSGLYFWTWNTEEVLDMIAWMRRHNAAGGRVGFYGFDMQYPGMALETVRNFVGAVDATSAATIAARVNCLERYANDPLGRFPQQTYQSQPAVARDACLADLQWVHAWLTQQRAAFEARSTPARFARALQSIRVAIQYEESTSGRRSRDAAMADNVLWLLNDLGPASKLVLWAHNYHVSTIQGAMGASLRPALGPAMVTLGFSFREGGFMAVLGTPAGFQGVRSHTVSTVQADSYERYLASAATSPILLDLRGRSTTSDSTSWLAGPRSFRSIGSVYRPDQDHLHWYEARLPAEFDLLVHFPITTPSRLLPFKYRSTF